MIAFTTFLQLLDGLAGLRCLTAGKMFREASLTYRKSICVFVQSNVHALGVCLGSAQTQRIKMNSRGILVRREKNREEEFQPSSLFNDDLQAPSYIIYVLFLHPFVCYSTRRN